MNFFLKNKEKIILAGILILALTLRIYGLNWDQGQHLHPDERFLTMVGTALKIPSSITEYLNPDLSPMNPKNHDFGFFVYGIFPITVNKIIAVLFNNDNYNNFTLQGRFLSALFDSMIVLLIYKSIKIFEKKYQFSGKLALYSSFFYAVAVLPIQLSHFFAMDSFLNFLMFAGFYFILLHYDQGKSRNIIYSAVFFGMALGTKLSALSIVPLYLFFIIHRHLIITKPRAYLKTTMVIVVFFLCAYGVVRVVDPYMFRSFSFLDPRLHQSFSDSINQFKVLETKDSWYPPAIQWIDKPAVIFSLINMAFFGVGIPYFILSLTGLTATVTFFWRSKKKIKPLVFFVSGLWMVAFFIYQSTHFIKIMRYFIFLYPFLAIFAGFGFYLIQSRLNLWMRLFIIIAVMIWPMAFMSIYTKNHSRVQASAWIYDNIPQGSYLAEEHWDDWLPLSIPNREIIQYEGEQMPVFGQDTEEKWRQMSAILDRANYIIFTSNRGYGSIGPLPEKYPRMSRFYQELFSDKAAFTKVKEFNSFPTIGFGSVKLAIDDQWSDESFTVYDHPKIMIFKKKDVH